MLVVVLHSLLFFYVSFCCFYVSGLLFHATGAPPCLSRTREGLHQLWALPGLLSIALLFRYIFTASATVLSGHFLPTGVFYLRLFPHIFATTCFYQGLCGSGQLFLEVCKASCWSSKHRPGPSACLIHSNPQSWYSEEFVSKPYQILP